MSEHYILYVMEYTFRHFHKHFLKHDLENLLENNTQHFLQYEHMKCRCTFPQKLLEHGHQLHMDMHLVMFWKIYYILSLNMPKCIYEHIPLRTPLNTELYKVSLNIF